MLPDRTKSRRKVLIINRKMILKKRKQIMRNRKKQDTPSVKHPAVANTAAGTPLCQGQYADEAHAAREAAIQDLPWKSKSQSNSQARSQLFPIAKTTSSLTCLISKMKSKNPEMKLAHTQTQTKPSTNSQSSMRC